MNTGSHPKREVGVRGCWFSSVLLSLAILLPSFVIPLLPRSGEAAPCTKGVNCYCDRVQGGDLNDTAVLFCEDWEATTLHDNVGVGNGAPYYGPWSDDTGYSGARGFNSYFNRRYGGGTYQCNWKSGQPSPPTRGSSCAFPNCFNGAWSVGDLWQANNQPGGAACTFIPRNGEFNAEIGDITSPTNTSTGTPGVFDGQQSYGHRVAPGLSGGGGGTAPFAASKTFGVTMAVAYPSNSNRSGIWGGQWKHNEWVSVAAPGGNHSLDGIFLFWNQAGTRGAQAPFQYQFSFANGDSQASCLAKVAAATKNVGSFTCDSAANFLFGADPSVYVQSRDWPDGTWGCVRGYYQNFGSSTTIQQWFTGPSGVEKKIVDISGMDLTGQSAALGYQGLFINSYANTNSGVAGYTPSTETTYRYEDNIHIRAGAPVSCSQIGFSGGQAPSSVPSAPSGPQLR